MKELMELTNIDQDVQDQIIEYARLNDLEMYSPPEILMHSSRDPNERPYSQGILFTAHSQKLKDVLRAGARKAIESGLVLVTMKNFKEIDMLDGYDLVNHALGRANGTRADAVENCRSESIIMPSVEFHAITA